MVDICGIHRVVGDEWAMLPDCAASKTHSCAGTATHCGRRRKTAAGGARACPVNGCDYRARMRVGAKGIAAGAGDIVIDPHLSDDLGEIVINRFRAFNHASARIHR